MTAAAGLASPSRFPLSETFPRVRRLSRALRGNSGTPVRRDDGRENLPGRRDGGTTAGNIGRDGGTAERGSRGVFGSPVRRNDGREMLPGRRYGGTGLAREFRDVGTGERRPGISAGTAVRRDVCRAGLSGRWRRGLAPGRLDSSPWSIAATTRSADGACRIPRITPPSTPSPRRPAWPWSGRSPCRRGPSPPSSPMNPDFVEMLAE